MKNPRCFSLHLIYPLVLLIFAGLSPLKAVTVISNLDGFTNNNVPSTIGSNLSAGKAIGFTIANQCFDHVALTLRLNLDSATGDIPLVEIWTADASHLPSALCVALTNPSFIYDGTYRDYVFTAPSGLILNAGIEYLVVVRNSGTSTFLWGNGAPTVEPSGLFATLRTPSIYGPGAPTTWISTSNNFNWMKLEGAVIAIIGNLDGFTNNNAPSSIDANLADGKAIGFTMGSQCLDHISLTLRLKLDSATGDVPRVEIWTADTSHTPGTLCATLSNPSFTYDGIYRDYTFTAPSVMMLNAGLEYYIVVRNSGTSSFFWGNGAPTVQPFGLFAALRTPSIYGAGDPAIWSSTSSNFNWMRLDGAVVVTTTVIGNLDAFTNNNASTMIDVNLANGKAVGFTMGNECFDHINLTLRLNLDSAAVDVPRVEIWTADASHTPSALCGTLSHPSFTYDGTYHDYIFTEPSVLTLNANVEYFVVVRNEGTSQFFWGIGSPTVQPSGLFAAPRTPAIYGTADPAIWASVSTNFNWMEISGAVSPKIAVAHFVPWSSLNQNIAQSQVHYDMPLLKATGDPSLNLQVEMLQAQSYGIDVFTQDIATEMYYGFSGNFADGLKASEGTDFRLFPMLGSITDQRLEGISALMSQSGSHPNWLRLDGRLVFNTFWAGSMGDASMYNNMRNLLEQQGYDFFIIGDPDSNQGVAPSSAVLNSYKGCFDMLSTFCELGRGGMSVADAYDVLSDASLTAARSGTWMAGIAPGYLGGWFYGRNDYYVPFRCFDQYLNAWEGALAGNPRIVYLATWNDRDETHQQPTLFQWDSALQISSYYIDFWKNGELRNQQPQFFCAYPREQIVGTVQRIEVICQPGKLGVNATVSGRLVSNDGVTLATLASRAMSGTSVLRVDWAVDTSGFTSPVVRPVLQITQGGVMQESTLPGFRLRSGWIANQSLIKIPLAQAGTGTCNLVVTSSTDNEIQAQVTLQGGDTIKSAHLFCNDRRLISFDSLNANNDRVQLLITGTETHTIQLSVTNGTILRALRDETSASGYLQFDSKNLRTLVTSSAPTAVEIRATAQTQITVTGTVNGVPAVAVLALPQIQQHAQVLFGGVSVSLPKFDALSDLREEFPAGRTAVSLRAFTDKHRLRDGYYARIETSSGKTIESQWVFPGISANPPLESMSAIVTPIAFDARNLTDYLSATPANLIAVQTVSVHPAVLQSSVWNFDDGTNPGDDAADRNPLTLGRGTIYLKVDPARVPLWLATSGVDGTGCLWFDGVQSRAQLQLQQEPKGPFGISFDIWPEGGTSGDRNILSGIDVTDPSCSMYGIYVLLQADGKIKTGRNGGVVAATSPQALPLNAWSHVDIRFSGKYLELFINGGKVAEASCSPNFKRFGNSRIYVGGVQNPFKGRLDNLIINGYDKIGY